MSIKEVKTSDSGDVVFTVRNLSSRTMLFVKDLEHVFSRGLRDTRAEEKGVAVLECETRRPSLRTTWLKGVAVLKHGGKYHMRQQGTVLSLTINHLEKSDGDVYTCDVGTARSSAALTIQGRKVVFIEELQDKKCLEGDTVVFKCCVCPSDFYDVRWYLDWTLLHNDHWSEIQVLPGGHHTLTMRNLARKDSGVITFEAGGKRTYAFLLVRGHHSIPEAVEDIFIQSTGRAVFSSMITEHLTSQSGTEDSTPGVNPMPTQGLITSTFYSRSREHSVRGVILDEAKEQSYQHRRSHLDKQLNGPLLEDNTHIPLVPVDLPVVANPGSDRSHQTYSFLSEINRGRFSVVWQCQDDWSKQLFAAKFTPYAQEQQQRALGEYQLLKKLSHIHIVQLHSAFITPCYLVLIQELCAGRELLHNLAERDLYAEVLFLNSVPLLSVQGPVCGELLQQIVHLDLKSENMLVTDHNLLKIVDLSSAQTFTPGQTLPVDHIQEMKAPEVLEKQGVGPETDIWAIGVLVFIMLSGDDPFQSELHWESRSNIKKGRIQFSRCYPGLSEGSVSFIKRTLNHKTWGRPSAAECLQLPWVKGWHGSSRHSDSIVCFSTDKLQAYLQEQETKREKVRTKMDMPLSN
ncbi:hypothetical protein COCON_G00192460 [Conger conger]|uniref:Obscurin n=1 Tax=Conger conger TaxID=82655 RepID=A0A9Q1D419_CONCO|nr:hypothetical protein COCON_G00192460 [Conger conger]